MLNFFLLGAFFTGVFSVAAYSVYSHNQNISSNIEKSDELKTSQKRVTLLGSYSATGNSGQSDVSKKINLSTLVEQKLSGKETEDMNNFQQAIRKVLIESNNENPSCSDLVNTGLINITDCNNIKDKLNNFARIDDKKIQVYNQDVSKIINNREYFNSKNVNEDNSTTFTTFTKDNLSASRNIISKQINKTNSFNNIIETIEDENELKNMASSLINKYELKGKSDYFDLNRIEKISNRIEYLKFKKQLDTATQDKQDASVILTLEEQYKTKLLDSGSYLFNNKTSIDEVYLANRLNELKQRLNY